MNQSDRLICNLLDLMKSKYLLIHLHQGRLRKQKHPISLCVLLRIFSEPGVEDLCSGSGFNMTGIQRYVSVLSLSKLYIQVKEIKLEAKAAHLNQERYSLCSVFLKSSSSNLNSL